MARRYIVKRYAPHLEGERWGVWDTYANCFRFWERFAYASTEAAAQEVADRWEVQYSTFGARQLTLFGL